MLRTVILFVVFLSSLSFCQSIDSSREDVERIVGAALTRNEGWEFLQDLSDKVGGRVTGSSQSRAAAELIRATLKRAGLENVRMEEYQLRSGWQRGTATSRIVSPVHRELSIGSYGWTPGTAGKLTVPLKILKIAEDGNFSNPVESYRGCAVVVDIKIGGSTYASNYVVVRTDAMRRLAAAGAVSMLIASDKPDRMLYTSAYGMYPRAPLPVLSLAKEDALFVQRLISKGTVTIELDVNNTFTPEPPMERNVIVDIPGTDSSEMTILVAHFDSWDYAQGADDNGSGVAALVQSALILKSLNIRPKSTIRFLFLSGEEQGGTGAQAYIQRHRAELGNVRAVLVMDCGAQLPVAFELHGRDDLERPLSKLFVALNPLGLKELRPGGELDSDHTDFIYEGVPALTLLTEPADYDTRHHAVTDTFDKVDRRNLGLDTAAIALAALAIANAAERPGPQLNPAQVQDLLKRTGMSETAKFDAANR